MNTHDWIIPDWPAPSWVKAVSTTRSGGVSAGVYASLNLAEHVADDPLAVIENRRHLREQLALPMEPVWLQQVHGCGIVDADAAAPRAEGDGAVSRTPGHVCAVMTADCLPVLLCDRAGTRVAAAHAGWRGLADGVIEAAVAALGVPGNSVLAWLGPAIGPQAFEVGADVRAAFVAHNPAAADAFTARANAGMRIYTGWRTSVWPPWVSPRFTVADCARMPMPRASIPIDAMASRGAWRR